MRGKTRLRKRDALAILTAGVLFLAGLFFGAQWLEKQTANPEPRGEYTLPPEEERITVNGAVYRLKKNLTTILLMGIDIDGGSEHVPSYLRYLSGGQADFLRVVVIDPGEKTVSQLEIDRDTMTPITVLGILGDEVGTRTTQICLSHGFGDGKEQSCELTAKAVSQLLQVPISNYIAMNLNGISVLNDALGGVTVTLTDDFSHLDPAMTQGTTLTLRGKQAEIFVRSRMTVGIGTNEARMARQQQYVSQLMELLNSRIREDREFAGTLLDTLSPYLITSMSRAGIINEAWKAKDHDRLPLIRLPGVHRVGEDGYMEFYADEDALRQTVLDVFYQKAQ